jgi:hypothetical protein
MSAALHLSQEQTGMAVSVATTCSLAGSLVVALVGWRLSCRVALLAGTVVQAAAVMWILWAHGALDLTLALGLFAFFWQGLIPFAMDLIVSVDSSRATAPYVLPLYMTGFSLGPLLASYFVGQSVVWSYWVALVGFAAAFIIYLSIFRGGRALEVSPNP